jgi:UDP-N-acetylmuramoylalanine--D-glutamate ligase
MRTDFTNKKVAILGYGVNNAELGPFLIRRGAKVTICDKNGSLPSPPFPTELRLGPNYLKNLTDFDVIFRTPGLPYLTPEIQSARQAGVIITNQTQLFLEECRAKTIGITGTKGKGTTASLIEACFQAAKNQGKFNNNVYVAGNIGASALSLLEKVTPNDWVILELSSFQLQDMTVSPHIAVVLNITSDHLDYHASVEEYQSAKVSIVQYQGEGDYALLYRDSEFVASLVYQTKAQIAYFSRLEPVEAGAFVENGDIILRKPEFDDQIICQRSDIKLIGDYNLENVTAAVAAAAAAGLSVEAIRSGVIAFPGLHHRLEFIAEKGGVKFYDDSKATTPDATIAAIESFGHPITLIIGGSSIQSINDSMVEAVVYIGVEGDTINRLLEEKKVSVNRIAGGTTMKEIVQKTTEVTRPGGIVLLSPAAASFGLFKNAEDRGNQFQAAVKAII